MPMVNVTSAETRSYCFKIVVLSNGPGKETNLNALGLFEISDSHFKALKCNVHRNSNNKVLFDGFQKIWKSYRRSWKGPIGLSIRSCKDVNRKDSTIAIQCQVDINEGFEEDPWYCTTCFLVNECNFKTVHKMLVPFHWFIWWIRKSHWKC